MRRCSLEEGDGRKGERSGIAQDGEDLEVEGRIVQDRVQKGAQSAAKWHAVECRIDPFGNGQVAQGFASLVILYGRLQRRKNYGSASRRAVAEIIYQTASNHFCLELLRLESVIYRPQPQAIWMEYIGIPCTYPGQVRIIC